MLDETSSIVNMMNNEMGMVSSDQHLCSKQHSYDTGLFDSMLRTLLNSIHAAVNGGNESINSSTSLESEPIDNILTVVVIWFLFGVIIVLVIGIVILLLLSKLSDDEQSEYKYEDDEEKQLRMIQGDDDDDDYDDDDDDDTY